MCAGGGVVPGLVEKGVLCEAIRRCQANTAMNPILIFPCRLGKRSEPPPPRLTDMTVMQRSIQGIGAGSSSRFRIGPFDVLLGACPFDRLRIEGPSTRSGQRQKSQGRRGCGWLRRRSAGGRRASKRRPDGCMHWRRGSWRAGRRAGPRLRGTTGWPSRASLERV